METSGHTFNCVYLCAEAYTECNGFLCQQDEFQYNVEFPPSTKLRTDIKPGPEFPTNGVFLKCTLELPDGHYAQQVSSYYQYQPRTFYSPLEQDFMLRYGAQKRSSRLKMTNKSELQRHGLKSASSHSVHRVEHKKCPHRSANARLIQANRIK